MPKNVLRGLSIVLGILFLCGCTATKDVEVRRYVEIKDRVDQNMEDGNAGFISGEAQPEDRSEIRKTRKIYVLEVSKGVGEEGEQVVVEGEDAIDDVMTEESDYEEDVLESDVDDVMADEDAVSSEDEGLEAVMGETAEVTPSSVEYKVLKDDTLQKISKKFYDSYSKWPKIYEANKDVISDPDRIKPGIVLQIPME